MEYFIRKKKNETSFLDNFFNYNSQTTANAFTNECGNNLRFYRQPATREIIKSFFRLYSLKNQVMFIRERPTLRQHIKPKATLQCTCKTDNFVTWKNEKMKKILIRTQINGLQRKISYKVYQMMSIIFFHSKIATFDLFASLQTWQIINQQTFRHRI